MAVKRHGTKWRADWRDEFGIRRRKDFVLKAPAENHEEDMRRKARESKTGAPPACHPDITLAQYAQRYLGNRAAQGIDAGTIARQEIDLRRHVLPRYGITKVREIHRSTVKAFLLSKLTTGESAQGVRPGREAKPARKRLARGSVRSIYHTLSGILSEAVEDRLIVANPIRGLWKRLNRGKTEPRAVAKPKALDLDQASRFLAAALEREPDHFPYFATLLWAGLRPGEGFAVTDESVDVRRRSLLVSAQIGQHGGHKATKTGEERTVELSARLAAVLTSAIERREGPSAAKVVSISGEPHGSPSPAPSGLWLFYPELGPAPGEKDAQRVYKSALRAMRRALEHAGLPTYFGLHSLRHTYGSGLISRGVSPAYVQQQMGHASIQQTVDTYGSWLPVRVPGAVDTLADATAPASLGHQLDTTGF